jgi:uncharacterized small protein (DUF1192 family)
MPLLDRFLAQIGIVPSVWMPFILLLAVIGIVIWRVIDHHYKGQLSSNDSLIELRDAQLQDYKDKLSGASPDEAKAQIKTLQDEIAKLKQQRTLTPEQKEAIKGEIGGVDYPGSQLSIVYPQPSLESATFADEIAETLRDAGWVQAWSDFALGQQRLRERGLTLAVDNMKKRSAMALTLARAMERAGLQFIWLEQPSLNSSARLYVDMID